VFCEHFLATLTVILVIHVHATSGCSLQCNIVRQQVTKKCLHYLAFTLSLYRVGRVHKAMLRDQAQVILIRDVQQCKGKFIYLNIRDRKIVHPSG